MFLRRSRAWRVLCLVAAIAIPRSLSATCQIVEAWNENSWDEYEYTSGGQPIETREITSGQDGSMIIVTRNVQDGSMRTAYLDPVTHQWDERVYPMSSEELDLVNTDMQELYWTDPDLCYES